MMNALRIIPIVLIALALGTILPAVFAIIAAALIAAIFFPMNFNS